MKADEAEQLWSMVCAVFDLHPERVAQLQVAWLPALEKMDASAATRIVMDWTQGRGPERMPTLVSFSGEVAALRAVETPRRSFDAPLLCEVCSDTGQVIVGVRSYRWGGAEREGSEQMAPCPNCERGTAIEFPDGEKKGQWGSAGFWRGRSWRRGTAPDTVEILL